MLCLSSEAVKAALKIAPVFRQLLQSQSIECEAHVSLFLIIQYTVQAMFENCQPIVMWQNLRKLQLALQNDSHATHLLSACFDIIRFGHHS